MKTRLQTPSSAGSRSRDAQAPHQTASRGPVHDAHWPAGTARLTAQRRMIETAVGSGTAQLASPEEEELQAKKAGVTQRQSMEEEEPLQAKGLPPQLKAGVEALSGVGMDDVQVHVNSAQPAGLQALAFAQGNDIHLGPGQEHHLPHEAWHVAQQRQGRVQPTLQAQGAAINDDAALEHEADVMGERARIAGRQP